MEYDDTYDDDYSDYILDVKKKVSEKQIAKKKSKVIDYLEKSNKVVDTISEILEEIIKENKGDQIVNNSDSDEDGSSDDSSVIPSQSQNENPLLLSFTCKKPPQISIKDYFRRIIKYAKPETSTIIISLIYIDRICDDNIVLSYCNIHRILLASILISIKYNEDDFYSNEFYAKVGGVSLQEINKLEYYYLQLLDFETFIDLEIYKSYNQQIQLFLGE